MNWRRAGIISAAFAVAADLALLASGYRVLIWQAKVNPGDHYEVAEYGDLGTAQQAQLVCRYFTGRGIQTKVLWYSSNNIMGRDECPFLEKLR